MVFEDGVVPSGSVERARAAMSDGAKAAGVVLAVDARAKAESDVVAGAAPAGECDAECERAIRRTLSPDRVIVARLSVAGPSFVLRGSATHVGGSAASGPVVRLEDGARALGRRLVSSSGRVVLDGGGPKPTWFVDGAPAQPVDHQLQLMPGVHVIRLGDGSGPGALVEVRVEAGEVTLASFPGITAPGTTTAHPAATPIAAATPPPTAHRAMPATNTGWVTDAALVFADRTRSIAGGGTYSSHFGGVGPRIAASMSHEAFVGRGEVSYVSYAMSKAEGDQPAPTPGTWSVNGGSDLDLALLAGARLVPSVSLLAGARWESHQAQDLRLGGSASGLFPSTTLLSVRVRAEGAREVAPGAHPIGISAALFVDPWSSLHESPSGASGTSPKPGFGWGWELGAVTHAGGTALGLHLGEEQRSARFSGTAGATTRRPAQTISDAHVHERIDSLRLSAAFPF